MNHSEALKMYHKKISDISSLIKSQKPEVIARAFIEIVDTIEFDLPDDYLFQELKKEIERITNKKL